MGRHTATLICLVALLASPALRAQYKVIEADGRITYTDRPPASATAKVAPIRGTPAAPGGAALPYELRQTAERYPVTLYSGEGCASCDAGRNALRQRGIPFTEKRVVSDADVAAFQRLEGSRELPLLRIGAQQLRGYADLEWSSYLDAAGYPKQSRLPPSYRAPEAAPLVASTPLPDPVPTAAPAAPAPAALPPALEAAPSGIRF